ncbi:MAG: DUF177 domain-containing protein [Bacteroidales bacterium]|jgi:uncharacterized metal-binding protein YceD (DUF177 family)|nr:DUF177 domain-containing protein [Bacteroidales bacterium]
MKEELYVIPFKGLSVGVHSFEWHIGKDFFAAYEMSEIVDADISVKIRMIKHVQFLEIGFSLEGWAEVRCDRCLDPLAVDIATEAALYVKFEEGSVEDDEHDVIVLSRNENELSLTSCLYEYAHLALPVRRVHPEGKCNRDMITRLEQYLVKSAEPLQR